MSAINEEDWRQLFYAMDANLAALRALRKTLEESSDRQAEQIRQALQTLASLKEHGRELAP